MPSEDSVETKSGGAKPFVAIAKVVVLGLVVWGIWRSVSKALVEINEQGFSIDRLRIEWLVYASVFYLLGMLPMGVFWHRVLHAMGQRPNLMETLRAFYIGHLGKYVPGKWAVIALRTNFIQSMRVEKTVAVVSVFMETLTMMGVGALVAFAILAIHYREQHLLMWWGFAMALGAGLPTLPPIFRRLVVLLRVTRLDPEIEQKLRGITYRTVFTGWIGVAVGWVFLGMSLWAILQALPSGTAVPIASLPLWTAATALALVLGFASLIPGGIGVREAVLMPLLSEVAGLGPTVAVASAVTLRLVWLLSELAISGILYVSRTPFSR